MPKAHLEQMPVKQVEDSLTGVPKQASNALSALPRVLCLAAQGERSLWRANGLVWALHQAGCVAGVTWQPRRISPLDWDVIVAYHPYSDMHLMDALGAARSAGLALVLVLDLHVEKLPVEHPDFSTLGLSTPSRINSYTTALLHADVLITHNRGFAHELSTQGFNAHFIPESWIDAGGRWQKPVRPRHSLNLGWIGGANQLEDVAQVRGVVLRVMREFPHLQLIIAGDDSVYSMFDALPVSRRIYLPSATPDDLPFVYGMLDLLLVPLQDTAFNRTLSELKVMEAGLRGIPWLASPVPAYMEWNAGGVCAAALQDWHRQLQRLVADAGLRTSLGAQGRRQALERHAGCIAPLWLDVLEQAVRLAKQRTPLKA